MIAPLFFLTLSLSPLEQRGRALEIVADVVAVTSTSAPLEQLAGEDIFEARLRTAKLLLVWMHRESGFDEGALGDAGRSCGRMQMQPHLAAVVGEKVTCDELRADGRLALRLGLEVMRYAVGRCGSLRAGLGLYAGGTCGARQKLVANRCTRAGAC